MHTCDDDMICNTSERHGHVDVQEGRIGDKQGDKQVVVKK